MDIIDSNKCFQNRLKHSFLPYFFTFLHFLRVLDIVSLATRAENVFVSFEFFSTANEILLGPLLGIFLNVALEPGGIMRS